jgi:hypothetical protein
MKNEFVKRNLIIFQAAFENSILATVHSKYHSSLNI